MHVIAGLAHLWHIPDDVPEAAEEVTICQEVDPRKKEMEKLVFGHGNGNIVMCRWLFGFFVKTFVNY